MNPKDSPIVCPVGEETCEYLDEVKALRQANCELSELVRTDTLTGIHNFRFFIQSLELELERTRRSGQPTTLIMVDLDHFKQVNDNWGHEFGNTALIQTAAAIRRAVRKLDIPCRYGGEEFAIILPSTDVFVGAQVAERIRKIIESTPLEAGDQIVNLTASFGVDEFSSTQNDSPQAFVKRADKYLYQAKEGGRNRVCHAVSERVDTDLNVSAEEKDALFGRFDED